MNRFIISLCILYAIAAQGADTPIKNLVVSGSSAIASGTFTVSGSATFKSGTAATVDISQGNVSLPNHSANLLNSGTVAIARLPVLIGATGTSAGTLGAAPAPSAGQQGLVLLGSGTWGSPGALLTGSNLGTGSDGQGLFLAVSGTTMQFKRIAAGSNITLTSSGSSVTVTASGTIGANPSAGFVVTGSDATIPNAKVIQDMTNDPDLQPTAPSAIDDEFAATSGTLGTPWIRINSGTFNVGSDVVLITPPAGSGVNVSASVQTLSGTAWTVATKVSINSQFYAGQDNAGIVLRDSSTGKMILFGLASNASTGRIQMNAYYFNSATSLSSTPISYVGPYTCGQIAWLKIYCDGTNLNFAWSPDGRNYCDPAGGSTIAKTAWLATIDQAGIGTEWGVYNGQACFYWFRKY